MSISGENLTFTLEGFREGVSETLPLAVSAFAYGTVIGVLSRQVGLTFTESVLMSGLVYTGAAQLVALQLWTTIPLPIITILLTTLIVNLRQILMSASLYPWFSRVSASRAYGSIYFLTDWNWGLTLRKFANGGRDVAYMLGSGVLLLVVWVAATAAGHLIGTGLQSTDFGLDFVLTAVFIALLARLWKGTHDLLPWVVAAVVAIAASIWLPGKWYILLGGLAGSIVGAIRDGD